MRPLKPEIKYFHSFINSLVWIAEPATSPDAKILNPQIALAQVLIHVKYFGAN